MLATDTALKPLRIGGIIIDSQRVMSRFHVYSLW